MPRHHDQLLAGGGIPEQGARGEGKPFQISGPLGGLSAPQHGGGVVGLVEIADRLAHRGKLRDPANISAKADGSSEICELWPPAWAPGRRRRWGDRRNIETRARACGWRSARTRDERIGDRWPARLPMLHEWRGAGGRPYRASRRRWLSTREA